MADNSLLGGAPNRRKRQNFRQLIMRITSARCEPIVQITIALRAIAAIAGWNNISGYRLPPLGNWDYVIPRGGNVRAIRTETAELFGQVFLADQRQWFNSSLARVCVLTPFPPICVIRHISFAFSASRAEPAPAFAYPRCRCPNATSDTPAQSERSHSVALDHRRTGCGSLRSTVSAQIAMPVAPGSINCEFAERQSISALGASFHAGNCRRKWVAVKQEART